MRPPCRIILVNPIEEIVVAVVCYIVRQQCPIKIDEIGYFLEFIEVSSLYTNPLYCFHNLSSSNLNVLDKSHNGNSNKL